VLAVLKPLQGTATDFMRFMEAVRKVINNPEKR
jgi:hypothetical protein